MRITVSRLREGARRLAMAGGRSTLAALLALSTLAGTPSRAVAVQSTSDRVDGVRASERGVRAAALPDVQMKAGALVTADGRTLWSRRAGDRRAMASITKIMTAVVAIEHAKPDDLVTIPKDSTSVGESTSYLRAGDKLPLKVVLEALLVKSGNDAAVALAEHVSGTEDDFVKLMNAKAADLGLTGTHFANPHGLDAKGHYTTAADLATLARYAMGAPLFREIVGMKTASIGSGARHETVMNTNVLLGNYTGANGIKTGWTDDAGYCVVASAQRDGIELYAVVLGTGSETQRFRDGRELLDWGFAHFRNQKLASAGTVVAESPVTDYLDVTVPAKIAEDSTVSVLDFDGPITRTISVTEVRAPVSAGQKVGVATFTQRGNVIATIPLVATRGVEKPNPLTRLWIGTVRTWRRLFGGQLKAAPVTSTIVGSLSAAVSY